ncbi:MAG: hypothetical protein LUE98_02595 [Tannerellaceae bacterium]|nr:hypothetical protein [Tannerellaceae bacterium]
MKKVIFYFLLLLGSVCTFTGCDNDDDDDNGNGTESTIVFNGKTYKIFQAFYDREYASGDEFVSMDLIFLLVESDYDLESVKDYDDIDDEDIFELFININYLDSSISLPKEGTYPVSMDEDVKDMTIYGDTGGLWNSKEDYSFLSGNCKIAKNGNIYTIDMDFVFEGNKTLKGTYKGTLKDYDE